MSIEAINWALNLAPVPVESTGSPSSPCAFVLLALANHAGPDGTAAFPSVHTLVRYTRLGERTVQKCLRRLEEAKLITPCRPEIIAAHIARADRRPNGWNLDLSLLRDDLTEDDVKVLGRQFPGLRERYGVHQVHPVESGQNGHGVHLVQERGAPGAPEPPIEPPIEPPPISPTGDVSDDGGLFPEPPGARVAPRPPDLAHFSEFYAAFPRREGRAAAERAFLKALRDASAEKIIQGARRYAEHCEYQRTERKYISHPATWLNKGRWDDEYDDEDQGGIPPWERYGASGYPTPANPL